MNEQNNESDIAEPASSPLPHHVDTIDTRASTQLDSSFLSHHRHYDEVLKSAIQKLSNEQENELELISQYRRVVDYLSAAQIYLKDNVLLQEPLKADNIKPRLLGHWGTCPGLSIVYIHCNRLIVKHEDLDMFLVVGPGHGAPAILANVYLSKALGDFYPQYEHSLSGVTQLARDFSREGGFPSHVNPQCPGTIHEGGELGYALAVAYGAAMGNPELIVTCVVGDGEAETGPTATAWHSHKFIDPAHDGAVIPVLHLNGFKISTPTIYGTMSDDDLVSLFTGYGYTVRFVGRDMHHLDLDMMLTMEWAYQLIKKIQNAARSGKPYPKVRWPVIIMRTPKGLGCVKTLHGTRIEGTQLAHQVPIKDVLTNKESFRKLEEWLRSYKIEELFDMKTGTVKKELVELCPKGRRRMAWNRHTNPDFKPLQLPSIEEFEIKFSPAQRGNAENQSCPTERCGAFLSRVIELNPNRFRIFSPDELESNKLDAVLKVTNRCYQWHEKMANRGGSVIEMLSEHTMQGFMQGFVLTGRFGLFPSYEAFLGIVTTMMVQYAKFKQISCRLAWKHPTPSINYIESSTLWRQEHNGFSHQNPGFINSLINVKSAIVRVFLPPDSNCLVSTINYCINSHDHINLVISSKNANHNWLSLDEAANHCRAGASIWKWAGTETEEREADIVLASSGNEVTNEVIAAVQILRNYLPTISVRVVNVTDLMILDTERRHPHGLSEALFNSLFTSEKPVIYNFHGYPSAVKDLIFQRRNCTRFKVLGYIEEGTTTTPFNMLLCNCVSRFHVAIEAINALVPRIPYVAHDSVSHIANLQHEIKWTKQYITDHNTDPAELHSININP